MVTNHWDDKPISGKTIWTIIHWIINHWMIEHWVINDWVDKPLSDKLSNDNFKCISASKKTVVPKMFYECVDHLTTLKV